MTNKVFVYLSVFLVFVLIVMMFFYSRIRDNINNKTNIFTGLLSVEEKEAYGLPNVKYARIRGVLKDEIVRNRNGTFVFKIQVNNEEGENNEYDVLVSWSPETLHERIFLMKKGSEFVEFSYEEFSQTIKTLLNQIIEIEVIIPPNELWEKWKNSDIVRDVVVTEDIIDVMKNRSDCTFNDDLLNYSSKNSDLCNLLIFNMLIDD